MKKEHPFYKYLFLFDKGKDKIVLQGKEIANYWNDIYDLFWEKGKMVVQKLNGTDFTEEEIQELFWDLYEDMSDDSTIINLWVPLLSKLEFHHFGDIYEIPEIEKALYQLTDEQLDQIEPQLDSIRRGLCEITLQQALEERKERELKKLIKGFKVKDIWALGSKQNLIIKQYLCYFQKAKEDPDNWALNLRNIIDNNQKKKGDLKLVYRLLCNGSIKGSTHEGRGIASGQKLRDYTKEEIRFCERVIRINLQSLINSFGLNKP
jgi:hypothetical protein